MVNRWQPKVDALIRLIADDSGATDAERATAKRKLALILEHHPESQQIAQYGPVREFMCSDLLKMRRAGISTYGIWTGANWREALRMMVADYASRLGRSRRVNPPVKQILVNQKREWGKA